MNADDATNSEPIEPGEHLGRQLLAAFLVIALTVLAFAFAFNVWVDPFGERPHAYGASYNIPDSQLLNWKIRQLGFVKPTGAILGNSRAWAGFSARGSSGRVLGKRPFDLGIKSLSVADVNEILGFLTRCTKVRRVVLLLDMNMFDANRTGRVDLTAGDDICDQGRSYRGLVFREYASVSALRDSIQHLKHPKDRGYDAFGYLRSSLVPRSRSAMLLAARGKAFDYLRGGWSVETNLNQYKTVNTSTKEDSFVTWRNLLHALYANGYSVVIAIPPLHLSNNRIMAIKGMNSIASRWRSRVVAINTEEAAKVHRAPFEFYDFELYFRATDANLFDQDTLKSGKSDYIEPSHFSPRLGDEIMNLMALHDHHLLITPSTASQAQQKIDLEIRQHPENVIWVDAVAKKMCSRQSAYQACRKSAIAIR